MELTPFYNYTLEQDNFRKEIIEYAYSLTGRKISLIDTVSTMASPNRWISDPVVTGDSLHPNDTGYHRMGEKFNTEIDPLIYDFANANHVLAWKPHCIVTGKQIGRAHV